MRAPLPLLLLIVGVSGVFSGHSLQYYHTGVSVLGHGLPEYVSVGYVDGIEIARYSSDSQVMVPVAQWMNNMDPEFWEQQTQRGRVNEAVYKRNVKILMSRFNHNGGFHSFQWMYGCELSDDGNTRGYMQLGYDGQDFLTLDIEHEVYIPLADQARISAQRWNSPKVQQGKKNKEYLTNSCYEWMRKYLENGKEELERRVRPEVKVLDQTVNEVTKLHCQVYGFYPRDVDVKWQKNGMDVASHEAKHVLPNSDGTYQIRVTVVVAAEDREGHSCHVDHASLDQTLTVKWEAKSGSRSVIYAVSITAAFITISISIFGIVLWMKSSTGEKQCGQTSKWHLPGPCGSKISELQELPAGWPIETNPLHEPLRRVLKWPLHDT